MWKMYYMLHKLNENQDFHKTGNVKLCAHQYFSFFVDANV